MSPVQRLARWIEDYWDQLLYILGSICLAFAGILPSVQSKEDWSWLIHKPYGISFITGVVCCTIGGLSIAFSSKTKGSLSDEVKRLQRELDLRNKGYAGIINDELFILYKSLGFKNNERISLYKHEGKAFIMLGRHSLNPELKIKDRVIRPDNQGCLGQAWRQGKAFVDNLPDTEAKYCQVMQRDWGMPPDITKRLTMKSRTIWAYSISNLRNDTLAIIVFESLRDRAFRENRLQEMMDNGEEKRIALLLEKTAFIEPSSQYALDEEY